MAARAPREAAKEKARAEPVDDWPAEFLACLGSLTEEIERPPQTSIADLRMPDRKSGYEEEAIDDRITVVYSPNATAARPWMVKLEGELLRTAGGVDRRFGSRVAAIEAAHARTEP